MQHLDTKTLAQGCPSTIHNNFDELMSNLDSGVGDWVRESFVSDRNDICVCCIVNPAGLVTDVHLGPLTHLEVTGLDTEALETLRARAVEIAIDTDRQQTDSKTDARHTLAVLGWAPSNRELIFSCGARNGWAL